VCSERRDESEGERVSVREKTNPLRRRVHEIFFHRTACNCSSLHIFDRTAWLLCIRCCIVPNVVVYV